ncbi:MAG: hypothetical protein ACOX88_07615 [Christensenellales bacterium]|jgi:hypothetical protein
MDFDPRNSQYFNSLPTLVQESVLQSGVTFHSEEDVRRFVQAHQEMSD